MCEFCTKHGEGRKWYLQMKNFSDELLHARLKPHERLLGRAGTRAEWMERFLTGFVYPPESGTVPESHSAARPSGGRLTEQAITRAQMVTHFGQIVPLTDVEEIFDIATSITRIPCGCRIMTTGKADRRYCFGLGIDVQGIMGKYPDQAASLEVLDRDTAKRHVREFDQAGLIHSVWTGMTPYVIGVCNCDRDCMAFRGYIVNNGPAVFFRAEYLAEVNAELCTGCKACMKACQFGAQFWSHSAGKVAIDPKRCFGCGVCVAQCPVDAISLVPRPGHPVAGNLWLKKPERSRARAR